MIVYRYEYPDGGGPFMTREGVSRTHPEYQFDDNTLYAAISVEALQKWFSCRNIKLNNNLQLVRYDGEILHEYPNTGEVIIKKDTAKRIDNEQ